MVADGAAEVVEVDATEEPEMATVTTTLVEEVGQLQWRQRRWPRMQHLPQ